MLTLRHLLNIKVNVGRHFDTTSTASLGMNTIVVLLPLALACLWLYRRHKLSFSITDVPGPRAETFWLGNLRQLMREQVGETDFKWQREYGRVVRFKAPLGVSTPLSLFPPLRERLTQVYSWAGGSLVQVREDKRRALCAGHGDGKRDKRCRRCFSAVCEDHRRMRRVLSPAFGMKECKALVPVFRDSLIQELEDGLVLSKNGAEVVDVPTAVGRATLDALGRAAFAYDFGALEGRHDELASSLHDFITKGFGRPSNWKIFLQGVMARVPLRLLSPMAYYPSEGLSFLRRHVRLCHGVARELVGRKTEELAEGRMGKDALSLIDGLDGSCAVKANTSETERYRLSDEELLPQLATILSGGHETTTNTLGWIILELARHPEKQRRLRAEIVEAHQRAQSELSYDEIAALPYLSAVVKETFRFDTVVPHLFREATRDDVLPLSEPLKMSSGKVVSEILVPKGTRIVISNVAYNLSEMWGHDSRMWRPERWLDGSIRGPTSHKSDSAAEHENPSPAAVGVVDNLMSFGSGHRVCLGWRFALVETQIFVFELVKRLSFEVTEETEEGKVRKENCLVMQPFVEGREEMGYWLPIRIRLVDANAVEK
ncbi:hypothetical protein EW146_g3435 [Bondarzewia mesenterica]|uniref:Cytochrome P450 n=1 Tax=Bondarzewia mesenterica TaxID=1095465 RepID=A0A4S4LZS5_9AGAM|nr:hypothetical protein EW146_g3435 [Bondarzewia mesenterica]